MENYKCAVYVACIIIMYACKSMNTLPEATLFNDHICDILKANDYWACVEVNPADDSLLCASKQEYILWNHGTVSSIG